MGLVQLADAGGYHHAIVLSPATYARHMFAENIATDKSYWQNEDAAWHLATQLMSRYSNLTVLGFRAPFPITPDVWTDAARLSACFFSQASRIVLLVPSDGEEHFKYFTQTCLIPLLTRAEEAGGRPNWRERFVAAVIGNVSVPNQLAPGIPFIKAIRFREISWLRDITAMMLLQRAIQEFWVPSKIKSGKSAQYGSWKWSGCGVQSGYSLSETIETKATVGMHTRVTGQMEQIPEVGRSKSVDSRRSSGGRRRRLPTVSSRSRSRSRHSTSSGYRSLDPEFEAQQIEETVVATRVINMMNECETTYLKEPSVAAVSTSTTATEIGKTSDNEKESIEIKESHEKNSLETGQVKSTSKTDEVKATVIGATSKEELCDSVSFKTPLRVETGDTKSKQHISKECETSIFKTPSPLSPAEVGKSVNRQNELLAVEQEEEKDGNEKNSRSTDSTCQRNEISTNSLDAAVPLVKASEGTAHHRLARQANFSPNTDAMDSKIEKQVSYNTIDNSQHFIQVKPHTKIITSSTIKTFDKSNTLIIDKLVEGATPSTLTKSVGNTRHSQLLVSKSAEHVDLEDFAPLITKTNTEVDSSQKSFDKYVETKDSPGKPSIPYIDSEGNFEETQSVQQSSSQLPPKSLHSDDTMKLQKDVSDKRQKNQSKIISVTKISTPRSPSPSRIHYWSVVNTPSPPVPPKPTHVLPIKGISETAKDVEISQTKTEATPSQVARELVKIFQSKPVSMPVKLAASEAVCVPNKQTEPEELSVPSGADKPTGFIEKKKDQPDLDESNRESAADPYVVHNIPIALKPNWKDTTQGVFTSKLTRESSSAPDLNKPEPSPSIPVPSRVEQTEPVDLRASFSKYETKKRMSYVSKTVTREHTVDKRTKTETKRIRRSGLSHLLFDDDYDNDDDDNDTDLDNTEDYHHDRSDSVYQTRSLPVRARSTTPDQRSRQYIPSRSHTISSTREPFPQVISRSTVTPSGRVLYVRSAAPSRISNYDFGSKKLHRTYSAGQFRLAEPTVISHSSPASPMLQPKVRIYPSPWRSTASEKLANASSQMTAPLASGYMAGTGVTCYAFTGTHYDKRKVEPSELVLCKDTSVWTGPDAAETYRLEVMFASRVTPTHRPGTSGPIRPVKPKSASVDVVDSKTNALNAAVPNAHPTPTSSHYEIKKLEKFADWWPILFYAISCFVALITMVVAYFCSRSDRESSRHSASGFWTWFQSLTFRFRHQQDELS